MDAGGLPAIPDTPTEDASDADRLRWANETLAALDGIDRTHANYAQIRQAAAEGLVRIVSGSPRTLPAVMEALVSIAYSNRESPERQIARDALITSGWLQPWDCDLLDSEQVTTLATDLVIYRLGYDPWAEHL